MAGIASAIGVALCRPMPGLPVWFVLGPAAAIGDQPRTCTIDAPQRNGGWRVGVGDVGEEPADLNIGPHGCERGRRKHR